MSYYSRLYNHRNAQGPDTDKKPFFSKADVNQAQNKKNGFFQAKLSIGEPGDKYEKEADAVADKVVSQPESRTNQPVVQKLSTVDSKVMDSTNDSRNVEYKRMQEKPLIQKSDASKKEEGKPVQKVSAEEEKDKVQKKGDMPKEEEKPLVQKAGDVKKEEEKLVQKMEGPVKEEEDKKKSAAVQTKREGNVNTTSPQVTSKIANAGGKGKALPGKTLQEMNASFGRDFSEVRIHNDSEAADLSQDLQALAFTHGRDIYFNSGKFDTSSGEGKHLLAHELTHVVQQGAGKAANEVQRKKIDHGTLVWPDFKGKVPKKPQFEAETSSDLTEFDSSKYPFKTLTASQSGTTAHTGSKDIDCEKGMSKDKHSDEHPEKFKAFTVNIEADPALIEVKAYMWQEKSWAMPWTTDPKAREIKAGKDISNCTSSINKSLRSIDSQCDKLAGDCRKHLNLNPGGNYSAAGATATTATDCASVVKPACISDAKAAISYTYKNDSGSEASAAQLTDCNTTFKQQMVDIILEDRSNNLLAHEQRHFDLTNQLGEQLTEALRAKAAGFADKNIEACTETAALTAAGKVLAKQQKELDAIVAKFQKKLSQLQRVYDSETNHGRIVKAQDWWGTNIDAGLPEESGKGKF
jgi:hypothetical protein